MKKITLILLSIFYLNTSTVAQTNTSHNTINILNGTILNENNIPLPYVNIISLNTGKGTISNENGNFSIDINSLNDTNTIRFQCIGYCMIILSEAIFN